MRKYSSCIRFHSVLSVLSTFSPPHKNPFSSAPRTKVLRSPGSFRAAFPKLRKSFHLLPPYLLTGRLGVPHYPPLLFIFLGVEGSRRCPENSRSVLPVCLRRVWQRFTGNKYEGECSLQSRALFPRQHHRDDERFKQRHPAVRASPVTVCTVMVLLAHLSETSCMFAKHLKDIIFMMMSHVFTGHFTGPEQVRLSTH